MSTIVPENDAKVRANDYLEALIRLRKTERGREYSICRELQNILAERTSNVHYTSVDGIHTSTVLERYPEMNKRKPGDVVVNGPWWDPNDFETRKKFLQNCIKMATNSIGPETVEYGHLDLSKRVEDYRMAINILMTRMEKRINSTHGHEYDIRPMNILSDLAVMRGIKLGKPDTVKRLKELYPEASDYKTVVKGNFDASMKLLVKWYKEALERCELANAKA